jgi:7-cyano-7-deazaguanine synthase in queuosine biosynthesis
MLERQFICGPVVLPRPPRRARALSIAGPSSNINLKINDISRKLVIDLPDLLTDLIEIATYVFVADQVATRGGDKFLHMGRRWRRRFRFVIAVREPNRWSSPDVLDALTGLLSVLSEDDYRFEFLPLPDAPGFKSYLDLKDGDAAGSDTSQVILFSGGLDSLAGALNELSEQTKRLVLVSHRSSSTMFERQKYLASALQQRFPRRLLHVPVQITTASSLAVVEYTQRTRSFLFAAIATAVALIVGAHQIRFFENGIMSFNLPIAPQVVGSRATRTTHPSVLSDLQSFLGTLLGQPIAVDNPFIWKTKAEVVRLIAEGGHGDLIRHTISCSHVRNRTPPHTHCGVCAQCTHRRFATLAADATDDDPAEMYEVDLLTSARDDGNARSLAMNLVRSAVEFSRLTDMGFIGKYAGELSRAGASFTGTSPDQIARNMMDLHRRYGADVAAVLEGALRSLSQRLVLRTLPEASLLRSMLADQHLEFDRSPIRDAVEVRHPSEAADDVRDYRRTSEIRLALDEGKGRVLIEGLSSFGTKEDLELLAQLARQRRDEVHAGRAPENYVYVPTGKLLELLSLEEDALRRRVLRFRKRAAEAFVKKLGIPLGSDAIIESQKWHGYRLNLGVRLLDPSEIKLGDCHDKPE